jgi:hypothetical protein
VETSGQPNLSELVLRGAADIEKVDTAFDAELLLSTLLGSVYAAAAPDRWRALEDFLSTFDAHLETQTSTQARVVRAVLQALRGAFGPAGSVRPIEGAPEWLGSLGAATVTGAYACGDRYGDQTSYVATFAYPDPELGGPEHAMVLLVDHNLGVVKDIMVVAPATVVLAALREQVATDPDELAWMADVPPATVGAAASAYLPLTDVAARSPEEESLRANRVIAQARCALLAGPGGPDDAAPTLDAASPDAAASSDAVPDIAAPSDAPASDAPASDAPASDAPASDAPASDTTLASDAAPASDAPASDGDDIRIALIEEFLDSPEAVMAELATITGARRESLTYCLGLFVDFATARGDAQRWSPRSVELFMLDWVHEHAVLDADDVAMLPAALGPWVFWAGRRTDLPSAPLQRTFAQVGRLRPEFERLCVSGERQSPAAKAMAQLLADGVDLADTEAVEAWLATYQDSPPGPSSPR